MNHYIELDWDEDSESAWLVIHTGSRNLGKQVAEYYQSKAVAARDHRIEMRKRLCDVAIKGWRELEQFNMIQHEITMRNDDIANEPKDDLCYLMGEDLEDYLNDMRECNIWSLENHINIFNKIARGMNWPSWQFYSDSDLENAEFKFITCIHNYVDVDNKIIRKGAISAQKDEIGLIPLNMRDGILLVRGKGNEDYNCSAPHGAGRIMSRKAAKDNLSMNDFQETMKGIYSSSIGKSTLDEAPMAYKDSEEVIAAIGDTVDIIGQLKPLYNFKDHSRE